MKEFLYFPIFLLFTWSYGLLLGPGLVNLSRFSRPLFGPALDATILKNSWIPCNVTKTTKNHYNSRKFLWECWRASNILSLIFQLFFISAKFCVLLNYAKRFEKKKKKNQSSICPVVWGQIRSQPWILSKKSFLFQIWTKWTYSKITEKSGLDFLDLGPSLMSSSSRDPKFLKSSALFMYFGTFKWSPRIKSVNQTISATTVLPRK